MAGRRTSGFGTPEEAALAGWTDVPGARARVVSLEPGAADDAVWVGVQLDGAHPGFHDLDVVTCVQAADGTWSDAGSGVGCSS